MGLFDFLKQKPPQAQAKVKAKVEVAMHEPTKKEMEKQWKAKTAEKIRNFQKDEAGLYPQEILLLSYLEGYKSGKEIARFWERDYGVDNVRALMASLEKRGFAKNGKLTELGKAEIKKNEYVLYMHRHKNLGVSMADMCILVNRNPGANYRDLLWGQFNKLSGEYITNGRIGLYRNTRYAMYSFLCEEKRYNDAFIHLSEAFFYDLNGDASPIVAPALVKNFRDVSRKLDYSEDKIIDVLKKLFRNIYAPHRRYTNDEVICIIVAYSFGRDEMAERVFARRTK